MKNSHFFGQLARASELDPNLKFLLSFLWISLLLLIPRNDELFDNFFMHCRHVVKKRIERSIEPENKQQTVLANELIDDITS
jgi:hypothetical protein